MLNSGYLANVSTYCLVKPICRPGGLSDAMGSLSQYALEGGIMPIVIRQMDLNAIAQLLQLLLTSAPDSEYPTTSNHA